MNDWENRFNDRPVRTGIGFGAAMLGGLMVLSVVGGVGFFVINLASQPAKVVQRTFDADNMIYNYEWFRTQYADIGVMDQKIANAQSALDNFTASAGPRDTWKTQDRQQYGQLNSIVLGLTNQRLSMVAAYNGNATKANKSIFMAGLPERIE